MSNFLPHSSSSALSLPSNWAIEEVGELPPGPSGRLITSYRLIREPIEALREWQAEFGHTFTVNRLGVPTVMTAEPELIGEIHGARDPELFDAVLPASFEVLIGKSSLLMLAGRKHQTERKLMTPPFHGERMRGWATAMADAALRAFFPTETEINVAERAQWATLEVIVRVIFGVQDEDRVREFMVAIHEWTNALRPGFLFLRCLQHDFLGLSPFARYRRAFERVDALLTDQMARTRAGHGGGTDVLTGLIEARYDDGSGMDDAAIRDHLRTLLFAGHETTATTIAWALHFIHRDGEVRRRLLAELASVGRDPSPEVFARLPYLGAVIDETLRMRPVTAEPQRLLRKAWKLGPWRLPAGVAVCPAVTLVHFRPDLWKAPECFRPERFIEGKPAANAFLPFGGGAHRCLGATFARFEAAVVLGTVLRRFSFEGTNRVVTWGRGRGSLGPQQGVWLAPGV